MFQIFRLYFSAAGLKSMIVFGTVIGFIFAGQLAQAQSGCFDTGPIPTLSGYVVQDHLTWIERPEADILQAAAPVEIGLMTKLISKSLQPPLTKTYCQVGVMRAVIDFEYSVEDDAISHIKQRLIYSWVANVDDMGVGWQLSASGQKIFCARERAPNTHQCL